MEPEVLQLSDLEPAFTQEPLPIYARMREESPVRAVVRLGLPAWLVTRHADVMQVLSDTRFSVAASAASPDLPQQPANAVSAYLGLSQHLAAFDAPDHTRLRRLVSKAFTPRRVEELRPQIQRITDRLIDAFLPAGYAELMADFAYPLPVAVISDLLGIPDGERDAFVQWSRIGMAIDPGDPMAALVSIAGYLTTLVESKRGAAATGATDLLSELVAVRDSGDQLSADELRSIAFQLLAAGFETTAVMISNGLLALLRHPEQLDLLRAQPDRIPQAVEEFLRFDTPVDMTVPRFALQDVLLGDTWIRAGDALLLSFVSATRDLPADGDPDAFDVRRPDIRHLAFGHGVHFCLGAPLARLEGEIAVATLLRRCEGLKLAIDDEQLMRRPSLFTRGLVALPVAFTAQPLD